VWDFAPRPKDAFDAMGTMRYYLGLSKVRPQFGRFNYAEKAEYWALVWGTALMGVTGVMLWAKVWVGNLLARWWVDVATAVHFYEAILATLAIVVWHFYQVFFDPDVYPMNWAWWDGKMPVEHYKHEHGLDAEALATAKIGIAAAPSEGSDAPVVGAPGLDALLDLLAGEVLFKGLLGQFDDFLVGGEAKADQLVFRELVDLRVPFGRSQGLEAEALLEADDAVLDLEGIGAQLEDGDPDGDGKNHEPSTEEIEIPICVKPSHVQVDCQDSGKNHVKRRIDAAVVLEVLRRGLAHGKFSIFFGLRICPERLHLRSSDASCDGGLIVRAGRILRDTPRGCQCRSRQR
jgi:hypothetical protein